MKRVLLSLSLVTIVGGTAAYVSLCRETTPTQPVKAAANAVRTPVAAPGTVEPVSEEIRIGAEISGKLRSVNVDEGQRISRGQVVAVIENDEYHARLAAAEAQLAKGKAELERVNNGSRTEERLEAQASIKEADAIVRNSSAQLERRRRLFEAGDISKEEYERAQRELQVAQARYDAVVQRHAFVDAKARHEDVARAEAEIRLAEASIAEARALLEKTIIKSPITGIVLRRHLRGGETVIGSTGAGATPVLTVADTSTLRVRVEIDETDVGRIHPGQKAWMRADAFGERKFSGTVIRVGEILGRKKIKTEEPTEKVDTKVLEVLVQLEPGTPLKPGLRMDTFIESDSSSTTLK